MYPLAVISIILTISKALLSVLISSRITKEIHATKNTISVNAKILADGRSIKKISLLTKLTMEFSQIYLHLFSICRIF